MDTSDLERRNGHENDAGEGGKGCEGEPTPTPTPTPTQTQQQHQCVICLGVLSETPDETEPGELEGNTACATRALVRELLQKHGVNGPAVAICCNGHLAHAECLCLYRDVVYDKGAARRRCPVCRQPSVDSVDLEALQGDEERIRAARFFREFEHRATGVGILTSEQEKQEAADADACGSPPPVLHERGAGVRCKCRARRAHSGPKEGPCAAVRGLGQAFTDMDL